MGHAIDTSNHPRIRLIYFAYCNVGEGWDIRRITKTPNQ